ncbi:MAG: hypothetical protein AAGJ90_07740, partial [Pseudomonadota bacterium]
IQGSSRNARAFFVFEEKSTNLVGRLERQPAWLQVLSNLKSAGPNHPCHFLKPQQKCWGFFTSEEKSINLVKRVADPPYTKIVVLGRSFRITAMALRYPPVLWRIASAQRD